jgi:DNA (cytosine-5)-methyltransferase 1
MCINPTENGPVPSMKQLPPATDTLDAVPCTLDLCCGMGGLSLAAQQMDANIIGGVDISRNALKTYSRNFPDAITIEGCLTSMSTLQRCHEVVSCQKPAKAKLVVLSGPPCQGFSAAGTRDPADPRNGVFLSVAKAIAALQPHCALIENVPPVLADKNATHLDEFNKTLSTAGFHIVEVLLDAVQFGVAQTRRRAFFLVTRIELRGCEIEQRLATFHLPICGAADALAGLPTPSVRPDKYDDEADCQSLSNHLSMRHSVRVIQKIGAIMPGSGPMSYRRLHPERPSNTLFSGHRAPPAHYCEPRSITVREAARLQGFPDSFRVFGSFSNQMEQVTNAVPPPLARAVLQVLFEQVGLPSGSHV